MTGADVWDGPHPRRRRPWPPPGLLTQTLHPCDPRRHMARPTLFSGKDGQRPVRARLTPLGRTRFRALETTLIELYATHGGGRGYVPSESDVLEASFRSDREIDEAMRAYVAQGG